MTTTFRRAALAVLVLLACPLASAGTLATAMLNVPLAPGSSADTSIAVPGLDPSRPVWVAYRVIALSADARPRGEVVMETSFEGVATSISDVYARLDADDMDAGAGSSLAPQLQQITGGRSTAELRAAFGEPLHAAYEAVVAGRGATLDGRIVQTLPAPGRDDAPLDVSVSRAEGMQPVLVAITVGQGEVPEDVAPPVEKQAAFRFGRVLGILATLGLIGWVILRRR